MPSARKHVKHSSSTPRESPMLVYANYDERCSLAHNVAALLAWLATHARWRLGTFSYRRNEFVDERRAAAIARIVDELPHVFDTASGLASRVTLRDAVDTLNLARATRFVRATDAALAGDFIVAALLRGVPFEHAGGPRCRFALVVRERARTHLHAHDVVI